MYGTGRIIWKSFKQFICVVMIVCPFFSVARITKKPSADFVEGLCVCFLGLFRIYVLATVGWKAPRTTQALTSLAAAAAAASAHAHAAATTTRAAAITATTFRESETKAGVREHGAFGVFLSEHGQEPDLSVKRPTLFNSET